MVAGASDRGVAELDGRIRVHLHGGDGRLGRKQRRGRVLLGGEARHARASGARRQGKETGLEIGRNGQSWDRMQEQLLAAHQRCLLFC